MKQVNLALFAVAFLATIIIGSGFEDSKVATPPVVESRPTPPAVPVPEPQIGPYTISMQIPDKYLSYEEVNSQLEQWHQEAPEITEHGVVGKVRSGRDVHYLRVGTVGKPKILIHACIHGNERLAAAATLGIMGKMLHDFKRNEEVSWIIENRDIYFVPVFSPDSYLRSRHIEEGDPNRRWPYPGGSSDNQSSPIKLMQSFFLHHKFVAAIDGHTTGRDFFWPSIAQGQDAESYRKLAGEMADLANYDPSRISSSPSGYAIDWYYWKGAVAILTEFGSGGHDQPRSAIEPETNRTYQAYLHFMAAAPEVQINPPTGYRGPRPYEVDWREE